MTNRAIPERRRFSGLLILASLLFLGQFSPAWAGGTVEVGVLQYNVKENNGGWVNGNGFDALDKQMDLIVKTMKAKQVDFITLEQAPSPRLTDELDKRGIKGWTTYTSKCSHERTQLNFSPDWEEVKANGTTNPIVDGDQPEECWDIGRPYNIAFLHNKKTNIDVLVVLAHFPHCWGLDDTPPPPHIGQYFEDCRNKNKDWQIPKFQSDVQAVVGATVGAHLDKVHLIVAGDMNELGGAGDAGLFAPLFGAFGDLKVSTPLVSCCFAQGDGDWVHKFDHIVANSGDGNAAIIPAPYPLGDPNFVNKQGKGNEEHKAIYSVVKF